MIAGLVVAVLACDPAAASVPVSHRRVVATDGHDLTLYRYGTHTAFWIIVGGMIVTIVGMLGFFRWKRWL